MNRDQIRYLIDNQNKYGSIYIEETTYWSSLEISRAWELSRVSSDKIAEMIGVTYREKSKRRDKKIE